MKGLIVRQPWANLILDGIKSWEIRGSNCHIRGTIGILCKGKWLGTVDLIDSIPIDLAVYQSSVAKHQVGNSIDASFGNTVKLPYKLTYAWVLSNPIKFTEPREYIHKQGCVIWINL